MIQRRDGVVEVLAHGAVRLEEPIPTGAESLDLEVGDPAALGQVRENFVPHRLRLTHHLLAAPRGFREYLLSLLFGPPRPFRGFGIGLGAALIKDHSGFGPHGLGLLGRLRSEARRRLFRLGPDVSGGFLSGADNARRLLAEGGHEALAIH